MHKKEKMNTYKARLDNALSNTFLRQAMDAFALGYKSSRKKAFAGMDKEQMIRDVTEIKAHALAENTQLLETFSAKARALGIHVHPAATGREANQLIAQIAKDTGSRHIVKSKSMTAEEIQLNPWLESQGLEVTETDLGEWIVQLRKEGPSHMVLPAIHLSKFQVADLFSKVTGKEQAPQIQDLVKVARKELRQKFVKADMGITGANYLIAETGSVGLVTNEGNARLVTTLPRVHVVLAGIDKVLPTLYEALAVNQVLPRNATGQAITSYVTWITGPLESRSGDRNAPQMHLILLDNGRTRIARDPVFAPILQCVRCGACANVCPVYRMVGGHGLGHIYIGAMGLVTTYFFHGRENARNLVKNCTNCGACRQVCAAGIDLPALIKAVHARIQDEEGHPLKSLVLARVLKNRTLFHSLLRTASLAQAPWTTKEKTGDYLRHLPMVFSSDHNFRRLPAIAKVPFRDRFDALNTPVDRPVCKIALFSGCVQDFVYPEQLEAAMKGFEQAGVKVIFPMDQTCCGLPAVSMGEVAAARDVAIQNWDAFPEEEVDYIVTLCASCASHLKHGVLKLFKGDRLDRAKAFSKKVLSYSQLLVRVPHLLPQICPGKKIAFHSPCHLCRGLGERRAPRQVIEGSGNIYLPTQEEETCCGFGGSFSLDFPGVSNEIMTRKLEDVAAGNAEILATECPGCVMQLRGGAMKQGRQIKVRHLSEILYPESSPGRH